jgi:hypothetical protein
VALRPLVLPVPEVYEARSGGCQETRRRGVGRWLGDRRPVGVRCQSGFGSDVRCRPGVWRSGVVVGAVAGFEPRQPLVEEPVRFA